MVEFPYARWPSSWASSSEWSTQVYILYVERERGKHNIIPDYVIWHRAIEASVLHIIGSFAKQWPEVWCAAISLGGTCIFLFQTLPDTFGIVAQQWSHIETLLNMALDHGENRGQSGRKWTFNFKTAFVDCVVWSVQDTRICSVAKGERSYHVFFQLLQACRETDRKYTYTVSCYIYMYICVYICISVIFIFYASQYKSCEYTFTMHTLSHTYHRSTQN